MNRLSRLGTLSVAMLMAMLPAVVVAEARNNAMILQSATSPADAGLYDHILPLFEKTSGIRVHVVAVGTGQALRNGRAGDGDVVLVHAKSQEEKFVAEGYGVQRLDVMKNDFVLAGPTADPARVSDLSTARAAFTAIAVSKSVFISRGDNSGTHDKELQIWKAANIDAASASVTWYREIGAGMGVTLNVAAGLGGYTLTDRGTWINFRNKQSLTLLLDGDASLNNPYGVILVNPERHPHVKAREGQAFINWLTSRSGQAAIAGYKINGRQLFFPNAQPQ